MAAKQSGSVTKIRQTSSNINHDLRTVPRGKTDPLNTQQHEARSYSPRNQRGQILAYTQGCMSPEEIAEAIQRSPGCVRGFLRRYSRNKRPKINKRERQGVGDDKAGCDTHGLHRRLQRPGDRSRL